MYSLQLCKGTLMTHSSKHTLSSVEKYSLKSQVQDRSRSIEAKRKAQSDPDNLSDTDKEFYRCMNEDDQFRIDGMKGNMVL
jgi:hypothetical protein